MKNRIVKWSKKKYTRKQQILALIPAAIVFGVLIPLFLYIVPPYIDRKLGLPFLMFPIINLFLSLFLIASGGLLSVWTIFVQFQKGKGTPIPAITTQKLIIDGPYKYCRNPMTLGTILYYLGIGVLIGSPTSIGLTLLFLVILAIYIKIVEEKELEARFGEGYRVYKQRTPFLIPLRIKKKKSEKRTAHYFFGFCFFRSSTRFRCSKIILFMAT